jgi:hypothetical protein
MVTELLLYNELQQKVAFLVEKLSLNTFLKNIGRKLALSLTTILTLALFKQLAQIHTKKKLWQLMQPHCSYKTLVVNINRFFHLALVLLLLILKKNRANAHLIKHIDSTDIPVCSNRKAKHHQVMKTLATWGKNGKGSFYGLKLHIIADLKEQLLSLKFTSGNVDDRSVVLNLASDMSGIFIADAGYVSDKLAYEFHQEHRRFLLAKSRSNMKKLATLIDGFLYATRMRIELNFRNLKMFFGLVTSLPRSVAGYLANYTYSLLAYCLA